MSEKFCSGCITTKPITEFYLRAKGGDKRQPICKDCQRAVRRKYYYPKNRSLSRFAEQILGVKLTPTQIKIIDAWRRNDKHIVLSIHRRAGIATARKVFEAYYASN